MSTSVTPYSAQAIPVERQPGHWVLAGLGKRVLRPGGIELTQWMLAQLAMNRRDRVVEFAPGMGATARRILEVQPGDYVAIERDMAAAVRLRPFIAERGGRCIMATAEATGLPGGERSVVFGEAMLTMQSFQHKQRIVAEAARLLARGGRYAIHELCLVPEDMDDDQRRDIQRELSLEVHVGAQPLAPEEWRELLQAAGLRVVAERQAPMRLLEPLRLLRDEGVWGTLRFASNLLRHRAARQRVRAMRRLFRRLDGHLQAIALIAVRA